MQSRLIHTPEEMHQLGKELIQKYQIFLLEGDLWAGKTTFTKGLAEWLWISPQKVQSPTYTYVNIYDGKLAHFDLYRLEHFDDLVEKGLLTELEENEYIVIERPKWTDQISFSHFIRLQFTKCWENERKVSVIEVK